MQISSTSMTYGSSEAQRLLAMLLQSQGPPAGQDVPSGATAAPADSGSSTPTPPTNAPSAAQFAQDTLASLLTTQQTQGPPSSAEIASQVIGAVDTDGDGSLSLDEIEKALGQDTASGTDGLSQAFGQLDANGDGKLSQDELATAIDNQKASAPQHHHHHHHHAGGAQASGGDLASSLLGQADTNGDGALSADEIASALGTSSSDSLTQAIASLDKDGDGKLDSSELASAFDAFRTAHQAQNGAASQSVTA